MKIVDEPAADVEAELRGRGIEVRRQPYDPKGRSLVSDFLRFLREPEPGDTVTLWEDERGRVRYYTAERVDPQLAALQERVATLSAADPATLQPRLEQIDAKLARLDDLEQKVATIDEVSTRVQKVDELAAQVDELKGLQTKVTALEKLSSRVTKLERSAPPNA